MEAPLDPARYRRWYETALGAQVDADEKEVAFALFGLAPGERVLDLGCADGHRTAPAAERAGWAVRLDRAAGMLAAARRRRPGTGAIAWV